MSQRAPIIELHYTGMASPDIVKLLNVPKSTVRYTVNRYKEFGTSDDRPRSRRPRTARTPTKTKAFRERIRRNPKRRMRKRARDLKIAEKYVRKITNIL